ncbi:TonB-dependent siderophore receptor [Orrella sp. JC864]|uniref:TonB-dependent siderophore receptor n=1 Tax=Orrella sp. JC864 TaxID=3120298 RepID=UPI0030087504
MAPCPSSPATLPALRRCLPLSSRPAMLMAASMALALAASPAPAWAQAAPAAAPASRQVDIPAGPLDRALTRYASQAGVELAAPGALLQGRNSAGLSGRYGVAEGFEALLRGHGLQAVRGANGAYTLRAIPAAGPGAATTLSPLTVVGTAQENPTAPLAGYLARRGLTGSKTDTPNIEIPQAISVVTRDQMQDQGPAPALQDALRYTPGLIGTRGVNLTDDSFNMRGFAAGLATTSNTPVFRDGMRQSPAMYASTVEPYGLERIEVLRGPGSVLFGQVTPGGLINVTTKRPTDEPLREIEVQGGSHDHKQAGLDLGGPLDRDSVWTYRLTAMARDAGTQTDYIPNDRQYIAPALTWRPSARTSLTLLASYQHTRTMYNWGLPVAGTLHDNPNGRLPRHRFTGEPDFDDYDTKTWTVGYLFEHRLNDTWTFRQNARYYHSDMIWDSAYGAGMQPNQRLLNRFGFIRADEYKSLTLDTQVQANWRHGNIEHTTLAGIDYAYTPWLRDEKRGQVAPLDLYDPVYGSPVVPNARSSRVLDTDASQLGFYLQEQMKIAGRWVVLAGLRHDRSRSHIDGVLTTGAANSPESRLSLRDRNSATTGRAGLVYLFESGWAPYVSAATSFEPESGAVDFEGNAFEPTKGRQYEIGVKFESPSSPYMFGASVYDLRRSNVLTADPDHPGYSVQTGAIRSRGLELEARADIARQWQLIGAYTYTRAKILRSNAGDEGTSPPGVPRHTLALWGVYRFGEATAPGLRVGAGARHVIGTSGYVLGATPTRDRLPSYTVIDAMLGYERGPWSLTLNVNNVLDKRYVQSCYYATTTCFYGEGRSAIARAAYRW